MPGEFDSLKDLSFERKLELLDSVWAAVVSDDSFSEVPDWHRQLLAERTREWELDPSQPIPWEFLREKLLRPAT